MKMKQKVHLGKGIISSLCICGTTYMPDRHEQTANVIFSEAVPMRLLLHIQDGLETTPPLQETTEGARYKFWKYKWRNRSSCREFGKRRHSTAVLEELKMGGVLEVPSGGQMKDTKGLLAADGCQRTLSIWASGRSS